MRMTISAAALPDGPDAVDLHDPRLFADGEPHAAWRYLRRHAPVHRHQTRDGLAYWSVTRYPDVATVLRDHRTFTSSRGNLLTTLGADDVATGRMVVVADPPRHGRLRQTQVSALASDVRDATGAALRGAVRERIRPGLDGEVVDLAVVAAQLPMLVLGPAMRLPEQDWARLSELARAAVAPDDPVHTAGTTWATLAAAHHELFSYFRSALLDRRARPQEDLLSHLLTGSDGEPREQLEVALYHCYSLLIGAVTTLPHVVTATAMEVIEDKRILEVMGADPGTLSTGVEEALRWSSPAAHVLRHTTRPVDLAGARLPAGEAVVAWLGSANRDETVFEAGDRFDPRRSPNRHLAFGFGPHYCLGAMVARRALLTVFTELVSSTVSMRSAGPVEHTSSHFIAGINRLPLRLIPR